MSKTQPFEKWSMRQKRQAFIMIKGRQVNVMKYIGDLAHWLEANFEVYDRETLMPKDQFVVLTKIYFKENIKGVHAYIQKVVEASKKTAEATAE